MTSNDGGQMEDRELLDRYRRASDTDASAPSDAVRAAILAEGRRVAAQLKDKPDSQRPFDTSRPAANDSRWKFTAFGTLGAALLAALIIAPRYWETLPASQKSAPDAASEAAPAALSQSAPVAAPAPSAPAPTLQSAPTNAARDSLQEVVVTQARRKREDAPVLPSAVPPPPSPLAAPRVYAEEKAEAAASARAADSATFGVTNRTAGTLTGAPNPARLNAAAGAGDVAQTVALIDKGTDVNARDGQGRTALMIAVARGRLEVVRLLLQRGADPNLADNSGATALREALNQNLSDIAAVLRDAGAR